METKTTEHAPTLGLDLRPAEILRMSWMEDILIEENADWLPAEYFEAA